MKKLLLILFIFISMLTFAQSETQKIIYLKNGNVINVAKQVILDENYILFTTRDGSTITIELSEIVEIESEPATDNHSNISYGFKTGYFFLTDDGFREFYNNGIYYGLLVDYEIGNYALRFEADYFRKTQDGSSNQSYIAISYVEMTALPFTLTLLRELDFNRIKPFIGAGIGLYTLDIKGEYQYTDDDESWLYGFYTYNIGFQAIAGININIYNDLKLTLSAQFSHAPASHVDGNYNKAYHLGGVKWYLGVSI